MALTQALGKSLMLFGEWCFAVRSVGYDSLPDWFVSFDVYDLEAGRFWSSLRRNALCESLGLHTGPRVAEGRFTREGLIGLFGRSAFSSLPMEGIYLRVEDEQHLVARAKLVRPEFTQAIEEHWMNKPLEKNNLVSG